MVGSRTPREACKQNLFPRIMSHNKEATAHTWVVGYRIRLMVRETVPSQQRNYHTNTINKTTTASSSLETFTIRLLRLRFLQFHMFLVKRMLGPARKAYSCSASGFASHVMTSTSGTPLTVGCLLTKSKLLLVLIVISRRIQSGTSGYQHALH